MNQSSTVMTIDVENWWHILDAPGVPELSDWDNLESRLEIGLGRLLDLLDEFDVKATMFWLGWTAERHPELLKRCVDAGHEIASQGYAHVLAYRVGREAFRDDVRRAKEVLERLSGKEVLGFRAAGFSITKDTPWAFDVIREAGHSYDASVFPAGRGHGGLPGAKLVPHVVGTEHGELVEIPNSVVGVFGHQSSPRLRPAGKESQKPQKGKRDIVDTGSGEKRSDPEADRGVEAAPTLSETDRGVEAAPTLSEADRGVEAAPTLTETDRGVEAAPTLSEEDRGVEAETPGYPSFQPSSIPSPHFRCSVFGGGYLRLAPLWLIKWGVRRLHAAGRPAIIYIHPRELDPEHPRLPLPLVRRFKSYVGLKSVEPKLRWLLGNNSFVRMKEIIPRTE